MLYVVAAVLCMNVLGMESRFISCYAHQIHLSDGNRYQVFFLTSTLPFSIPN